MPRLHATILAACAGLVVLATSARIAARQPGAGLATVVFVAAVVLGSTLALAAVAADLRSALHGRPLALRAPAPPPAPRAARTRRARGRSGSRALRSSTLRR